MKPAPPRIKLLAIADPCVSHTGSSQGVLVEDPPAVEHEGGLPQPLREAGSVELRILGMIGDDQDAVGPLEAVFERARLDPEVTNHLRRDHEVVATELETHARERR